MPQTRPAGPFDHVPASRLIDVAHSDELLFTDDEFNHLKQCSTCFLLWKDLIRDQDR